jgi:hypothetical protein
MGILACTRSRVFVCDHTPARYDLWVVCVRLCMVCVCLPVPKHLTARRQIGGLPHRNLAGGGGALHIVTNAEGLGTLSSRSTDGARSPRSMFAAARNELIRIVIGVAMLQIATYCSRDGLRWKDLGGIRHVTHCYKWRVSSCAIHGPRRSAPHPALSPEYEGEGVRRRPHSGARRRKMNR